MLHRVLKQGFAHVVFVSQASTRLPHATDVSGKVLAGMQTFTFFSVAMCLVLINSKGQVQCCSPNT